MRAYVALLVFFIATDAMAIYYNAKNHINFGLSTFYRDYSEALTPPRKSDESGMLYGIILGYERKAPNAIMFAIDLNIAAGKTNYDGSLQNMYGDYVGPWKSKTANAFVNIDTELGYTFLKNEKHLFTPFIGFGYSEWDRDLIDYFELYVWSYYSFGLQYDYDASEKLQCGLHAKIMPMVYGAMEIEDLPLNEIKLGNKTHLEISVPIVYKHNPCRKSQWKLTPYYQYQSFGESNSVPLDFFLGIYLKEPASHTHIVGFKAEFGFGL